MDHSQVAIEVDDLSKISQLSDIVIQDSWQQFQRDFDTASWTLTPPKVLRVIDRIRGVGQMLDEHITGRFYTGIKTGYNKAFIIDESVRNELVKQDPKSVEIIKPWLRGRNVSRWQVEFSGEYIIFTHRGISINDYPVVKKYLAQYRKRLEKRATSHLHPWYELQQPQTGIYERFPMC